MKEILKHFSGDGCSRSCEPVRQDRLISRLWISSLTRDDSTADRIHDSCCRECGTRRNFRGRNQNWGRVIMQRSRFIPVD